MRDLLYQSGFELDPKRYLLDRVRGSICDSLVSLDPVQRYPQLFTSVLSKLNSYEHYLHYLVKSNYFTFLYPTKLMVSSNNASILSQTRTIYATCVCNIQDSFFTHSYCCYNEQECWHHQISQTKRQVHLHRTVCLENG